MLYLLSRTFTEIPFNRMLGLHLDEIANTHVIMSFNMKEDLVGNFLYGILHGGVISSVLDMAGGMVIMVNLVNKNLDRSVKEIAEIIGSLSTIDLQISYLRPGKGERFTAKSYLLKHGKKVSFVRMELFNEENTVIAAGSGTYTIK